MGASAQLELYFADLTDPMLQRTEFHHPLTGEKLLSVRGKTGGVFGTHRTFQWTSAVQGLCIVVLRALYSESNDTQVEVAFLSGGQGSLAASLDYALDKQPVWLLDMFGVSENGVPLIKRIFRRSNPGRRGKGPVSIALNTNFLDRQTIKVFVDERPLDNREIVNLLHTLEEKAGVLPALEAKKSAEVGTRPVSLATVDGEKVHDRLSVFKTPFVMSYARDGVVFTRLYEDDEVVVFLTAYSRPEQLRTRHKVTLRIQLACLFGEILDSQECDCSDQSKAAVEILRAEGGILAYICPKHRDAQLFSRFLKLATLDSSNALNIHEARDVYLGHEGEKRQLRIVAVMMQDLGLTHVSLLSNNPVRAEVLTHAGIRCETRPLLGRLTPQNLGHLHSKLTQRRHQLTPIFADESELFYCEASFRNKQAKTWILGGDDTLWEDEIYYEDIIRQFIGYVGHWLPAISYREIRITLDQISVANSAQHGFGPHVFAKSLTMTFEKLQNLYNKSLPYPKELLDSVETRLLQIPVRVTPEAEELLLRIKQGGDSAVLFTQGPVDVQLRKVAQLLIAGQFDAIAITKKKSRDGYLRLIQRLGVADTNIVVVGNNLETDIVPATELKLDTIFFNTPNSWSVLNRVDTGSLSYREVRRLREIWTESTETKVALG